jgi:thioredoxin 1
MSTIIRHQIRIIAVLVIIFGLGVGVVWGQSTQLRQKNKISVARKAEKPPDQAVKPQVTFVELGSVRCIPCKQMQPVMKAIETKYGNQVKVVFHDVWTDAGKPQADIYKIKLIPTQVFLDELGKEFFRHEGFYPESEIDKLLQKRGLKIRNGG